MDKKILICMCTRNRAHIMLNSIKSIIDQTYKNFDLLIIDDASTDNTKNVLEQLKSKYSFIKTYTLQKHNFIDARNAMFNTININEYDYIALIDSDDLYKQDKLENQIKYFESHPELDVVSSRIIFSKNNYLTYTIKDLLHNDFDIFLKGDNNMAQVCHFPSIMFKPKCLSIFKNNIYFYPECENGGEDQIFLYTLFNAGFKFGNCSKSIYLYNYCKYSDSISSGIGQHTNQDNFIFKNFFNKSYNEKIELVNSLFNKYN